MKIIVLNNMAPFVWGGAEELAGHLAKNLARVGHEAEVIRIPFQWEPFTKIPSQMLLARFVNLDSADRVIALKFPAYLAQHPNKTLWLLHQYRQAYDLFDAHQSNLNDSDAALELRQMIRSADNESFREARKIYTNSEITKSRLDRYNPGFDAEVLLPPLNDPELFDETVDGNYIYAGGRVNLMKRQHLLVEAMRFAPKNASLVIAGPPESPADTARLVGLVEDAGLADRVHLHLRFLDRKELAKYVCGALACAYLPFDEDSLGYVSMEAATAGKAIITATDSGGILGLAKHGETGWVSEPTAEGLGAAITAAYANRAKTMKMGLAAKARWQAMDVTWSKTIEKLLL